MSVAAVSDSGRFGRYPRADLYACIASSDRGGRVVKWALPSVLSLEALSSSLYQCQLDTGHKQSRMCQPDDIRRLLLLLLPAIRLGCTTLPPAYAQFQSCGCVSITRHRTHKSAFGLTLSSSSLNSPFSSKPISTSSTASSHTSSCSLNPRLSSSSS